jgi:hypothetical protein
MVRVLEALSLPVSLALSLQSLRFAHVAAMTKERKMNGVFVDY